MIRFLQHHEINREVWDACISRSCQGLIYGHSWYLDIVSPGWCALEMDEYSAIMPLPVKKKYGINYIIQPLFAQQLGIFSEQALSPDAHEEFFKAIPLNYKFVALNLNFANAAHNQSIPLVWNKNYELLFDRDYQSLAGLYSANTKRNLQKAKDIVVTFDGGIDGLLAMKSGNTAKNRRRISIEKIRDFMNSVKALNSGFVCSASLEGHECAAVFFLQHEKRIYYLIPVSNSLGKEKKAMFAIVDHVIQKFAGTNIILDFEGSNISGIARFFEGFGAVNHQYPSLKINRMPFPLNQFRKS